MKPGSVFQPVRIEQVYKLTAPLMRLLVGKVDFQSEPPLAQILQQHPRLIHIMNHSTMLAPWVATGALAEELFNAGGGQRAPFAIMHKRYFTFAPVRDFMRRNFNTERPLNFLEVADQLNQGEFTDFCVFPEGANEQIGDVYELSAFKSHRYLELAIEIGAPILITVHRGTEKWASTWRLDSLSQQLLQLAAPGLYYRLYPHFTFNVQAIPLQIQTLRMRSVLYLPRLQREDLHEDPIRRNHQIFEESLEIRKIMLRMLRELDNEVERVRFLGMAREQA
jgi:hypothetical protein